jgi:hypothetical protein
VIFEAKFTNPELALSKENRFFGTMRAMEWTLLLCIYMSIKPIVIFILFAMINEVNQIKF